jgi:hypothetical protein
LSNDILKKKKIIYFVKSLAFPVIHAYNNITGPLLRKESGRCLGFPIDVKKPALGGPC